MHAVLVTVEDGAVVNGFGASLAGVVQTTAPEVRVVPESGTGELVGLLGAGSYAAAAMEYTMKLAYDFS